MEVLKIPKQNIGSYESFFDRIKLTNEAGLHLSINQVNWPNDFPKTLLVTVNVAHDNEKIYLYYQVKGEEIRSVITKDFQSVWEDSCVEFFVQRLGEKLYRNFEFNVQGVLLASQRESRDAAENLSQTIMSSIVRFATIRHYYKVDVEVSDWTLYVEIPKEALGFSADEKMSDQTIRANFYKCGDKTFEPHFISWKPIDLPKPNFHVPQFFGELTFE
ncbi:MAG: carbohydrate-binding family 9-like protein [Candidatus Saccharimonadaceae bacterium]